MTDQVPGPPSDDHVSVTVLADAAEDLLPAAEVARVNEHLSRCAACTELAQALTDACDALRDLPAPPMPEPVFERLSALVRAESQRRASGEAEAEAEAAIAEAVRRTDLGTFRQNPIIGKTGSVDQARRVGRTGPPPRSRED